MCAAGDADASALIAFFGYAAVRGLDAVAARGDKRRVSIFDFYAVVAFEGIVNTSDEKSQIIDL